MITLFTTPKPFLGHAGLIQRNAIRSWTMLDPRCQVLILGDERGAADCARELNVRWIPDVARNEYGTPLLDSVFRLAEKSSENNILAFVNADIIFLDDFTEAIRAVTCDQFLLIGQRTDVQVDSEIDMRNPSWRENLRTRAGTQGRFQSPAGMDYFVFRRGTLANLPPFAIGRFLWDNWLVYHARHRRMPVIDATGAVMAIHQNHDYQHAAASKLELKQSAETACNLSLGRPGLWYNHRDADWKLIRRRTEKDGVSLCWRRNWLRYAKPVVRAYRRLLHHEPLVQQTSPLEYTVSNSEVGKAA